MRDDRPDEAAHDVRAAGHRVEALIEELGALADPVARARAEELVRLLVGLYGAALDRVMRAVVECEAAEVLRRLTADETVAGLLVVHDLHPLGTADRVRAALRDAGERLNLAAGDLELLEATEDAVRVRLAGGHGCAARALTDAVREAVRAAAPEAAAVEVEAGTAPPLLQIGLRAPARTPGEAVR
ncbi:hypothetical protein Sru01_33620 [Sphaerisporangium rufum]|uniref:NifU family protein n=1 Tax=Sphaerisporangium rufum TaxID=1381558 RepID=A0A919R707_9ACTN|nr:NifU family protein [Sphaerisporangium rufum]GII78380.1 hypothetical protein Sru01_33620 [Sphaerisporangium rufum]